MDPSIARPPVEEKPERLNRLLGWKRRIGSRVPQGSTFYSRVLPAVILILGLITVILIIFAVGIITGLIPFV